MLLKGVANKKQNIKVTKFISILIIFLIILLPSTIGGTKETIYIELIANQNDLNDTQFESIEWDSMNNKAFIYGWKNPSSNNIDQPRENKIFEYFNGNISEIKDSSNFTSPSKYFWKPNGEFALIKGTDNFYRFDGKELISIEGLTMSDNFQGYSIKWNNKGDYALILAFGKDIQLFKYNNERILPLSEKENFGFVNIKIGWHPNEDYLILGCKKNYNDETASIFKLNEEGLNEIHTNIDVIRKISWQPDGKYALITTFKTGIESELIKSSIYKYENEEIIKLDSSTDIENKYLGPISWEPGGKYALIIGKYIYKYNGENLIDLSHQIDLTFKAPDETIISNPLYCIAWKPNGNMALIGGGSGTPFGVLLKYESKNDKVTDITDSMPYTPSSIFDIAWEPGGEFAILITHFAIFKFTTLLENNDNKAESIPSFESIYFLSVIIGIIIIRKKFFHFVN